MTFDVTYARYYGVTVQADTKEEAIRIADSVPIDKLARDDDLGLVDVEVLSPEELEAGIGWTTPITGDI